MASYSSASQTGVQWQLDGIVAQQKYNGYASKSWLQGLSYLLARICQKFVLFILVLPSVPIKRLQFFVEALLSQDKSTNHSLV